MKQPETIVRVLFKPNCGLENTRASLIVRRIAPLCSVVSTYPEHVKSDPSTIPYLRDNGLFVRFTCTTPEWVLLSTKNSFFVEQCTLVDDPNSIPPFVQSGDQAKRRTRNQEHEGGLSPFANADERDDELSDLLNRLCENRRALGAYASEHERSFDFDAIMFEQDRVIDDLRSAVARARIEQFGSIAATLHAVVVDHASRANVQVALELEDSRIAIDRASLISLEEAIKRTLRACIRGSIERPDERIAAGKPPCATIRLGVENDGPSVACHIEHDGRPFDVRIIGELAEEHGLLTHPLSRYTDDELSTMLPLLRASFADIQEEEQSSTFEICEICAALQRIGGSGETRNTGRGTVEICLHVPVPLTAFEIAQVSAGGARLALPAQHIERFMAYRDAAEPESGRVVIDGTSYRIANGPGSGSPFETKCPALIVLLNAYEQHVALALDSADGYEYVPVRHLPRLLDGSTIRRAGCRGYATMSDGTLRPVLNVRHLNPTTREEASHA